MFSSNLLIAQKMLFVARAPIQIGLTSLFLLVLPETLLAGDFNDGVKAHIEYPGWFQNAPFLELDEDLKEANRNGKLGLMVLYTTEGCSYCNQFVRKNLADPHIATTIQQHFISVGLEIFSDVDMVGPDGKPTSVKDFAKQEGVQFAPTILFYGPDGNRLLRITGYQTVDRFKKSLKYIAGNHYRSQSLAEYVQQTALEQTSNQRDSEMKPDSMFGKPPHLLQRNIFPAQQPLLIIFEKPGCKECNNFHDVVLSDKKIRQSLKQFEVVRLNATDDKSILIRPDGRRVTPASWFRQLNFSHLPALIFYAENGNQALKTDALVKNQRMMNSMNYMLEHAYEKGWTYQRFARSKAIESNMTKQLAKKK